MLPHLLVSTPDDPSFHALGQTLPLPIQNLTFACDQTGRMQWDLTYTDTFTIPRLSWDLKLAAVHVFQLLGLWSEGCGQCMLHGECSTAHSSGASLLLLLSSPLCQGSTIGHFSSGLLLKEWGWAKLESEVGRVASWVALPCPGRALAVADCIILFPLLSTHTLSPGASDGFWCYEGALGRAVRDLQVGIQALVQKYVSHPWARNLDCYRHLTLVIHCWDIDRRKTDTGA